MKQKTYFTRIMSLLLVLILCLSSVLPAHVFAEEAVTPTDPQGVIPEQIQLSEDELAQIYRELGLDISTFATKRSIQKDIWDNTVLDSLQYLGYNVAQQKADGKLYDTYYTTQYSYASAAYGSGIPYDSVGNSTGYETVADGSTVTGRAPNVSKWRSYGLCCASFATYYLTNYLPNIDGSGAELASAVYTALTTNGYYHNPQSAYAWYYGMQKLVNDGTTIGGEKVEKYTASQRAAALERMLPGDVVIFTEGSDPNHVAIYIGADANGNHWIAHVANDKGPGLDLLEVYESWISGKGGTPIYYHLPRVEERGYIEVNKTDTNGTALSGATFKAVNNATQETFYIGPTENGYAKSVDMPLGTYTVTETVFPSGYTHNGTTSWTVTLTSDHVTTPYPLNVVNKALAGMPGQSLLCSFFAAYRIYAIPHGLS